MSSRLVLATVSSRLSDCVAGLSDCVALRFVDPEATATPSSPRGGRLVAAATKSQRVIQREKHTQEGGQARFYSECSYAIAVVNCGVWGCGVMGYGSHPVAFDTCMVVQRVHRFCQVWGPGLWIMTSCSDAHRLSIT